MSDTAPEGATLPLGVLIGNYRIVRLVGQGGMGVVYAAEDQRLGRQVALKLLSGDAVGTGHRLHRFFQEARTVSALNHPGIVTIYESGESPHGPFIAMELVEGRTLRRSNPIGSTRRSSGSAGTSDRADACPAPASGSESPVPFVHPRRARL